MAIKLPMDVKAIQECIPHRYPFLLLDRVLEVEPNERILATRAVSYSDPMLQGHFPENPVVPGVLIVEAMAQAAGVLGHLSFENGLSVCLLTEISNARFKRKVIPGDIMQFDVRVKKQRPPFHWFEALCEVEGQMACKVTLSAFIK